MKIGFVVMNPLSEGLGFSFRPFMLIKYLSLHDRIRIHVFTPFNENLGFRNTYVHRLKTPLSDSLNRITYGFSRRLIKKRFFASNIMYSSLVMNGFVRNLANSLKEILKKHPVDILQAEQDIPAAAATLIKDQAQIPIVSDIHDLWVDEEILAGRITTQGKAFNVITNVTRQATEGSDLVLVTNELMKKILQTRFSTHKIAVSPNAGEVLHLNKSKSRRKRVVYIGNFERYTFVDFFLQSARFISTRAQNIEVQLYGKGPEEKNLMKLAKKLGLPQSIFRGFVSRNQLIEILSESMVGVVPSRKRYATPMKLFDYLSVGLPVVTVKDMWWSKVIEEYKAGKTSEFDPESYAEAILELVNSQDIEAYSEAAVKIIVDKYNWYNVTSDLIAQFEDLF